MTTRNREAQLNIELPKKTRTNLRVVAMLEGKTVQRWALDVLTEAAKKQIENKKLNLSFEFGLAC